MINVTCRHDNLSPFKIHDFRLSSRRADNQLAGKGLSHMETLGYCGKKRQNIFNDLNKNMSLLKINFTFEKDLLFDFDKYENMSFLSFK